MKSLKLLFAAAILAGGLACVNTSFSTSKSDSYAMLRVRTVPSSSSSDQKKKDDENGDTPKPQNTSSKNSSGLFCSQTNTLKTTLAVANGGAPK